ncbi:MAG: hypothetical protein ACI80V_001105 [Rhodothermales bacterium]|jgi:hypothetical protein
MDQKYRPTGCRRTLGPHGNRVPIHSDRVADERGRTRVDSRLCSTSDCKKNDQNYRTQWVSHHVWTLVYLVSFLYELVESHKFQNRVVYQIQPSS